MKLIVLWTPISPLFSHQPCNLSCSSGALEGMGFKSYSKVDNGYTCPRKKGRDPSKDFLKGCDPREYGFSSRTHLSKARPACQESAQEYKHLLLREDSPSH